MSDTSPVQYYVPPRNGAEGFQSRYSAIIQTVTVAALFVGGFWAGVIGPLQTRLDNMEHRSLNIREHEEFKLRMDKRNDDMQREVERIRDALVPRTENSDHWTVLNHNLDKIHEVLVPRAELSDRFKDMNERISTLSDRIQDTRRIFETTYNIGDQLKNLQKQLDDIRLHGPSGNGNQVSGGNPNGGALIVTPLPGTQGATTLPPGGSR